MGRKKRANLSEDTQTHTRNKVIIEVNDDEEKEGEKEFRLNGLKKRE